MGKKRRIMTSGQKFVKKYRSFLEKAGDAATGGDSIINVPGQDPVISEAEVYVHGNGEVSFRSFVENLSHAGDVVKLTLDGTALSDAPIEDAATSENIAINGINPAGKTATGQPVEVAALAALTDVTVGNAMLANGGGQLVVAPGKHTLVANVLKNGGALNALHEKKIDFQVLIPKVDLSKISAEFTGTGVNALVTLKVAGANDTALNVTTAAGSCSGERGFTIGTNGTTNKVEVLFFQGADDTAIATPGDEIRAANSAASGAIHNQKTAALSLAAGTKVKIKLTAVKIQALGAAVAKNAASERVIELTIPAA
jgi:hypothetical protein